MNLIAGFPYSLIKNGLPFQYPKLNNATKTDVVILGGGISGALAAYHLISNGINCIVVDGRTIGLGSTCSSTSLLQYEIDVSLTDLIKRRGSAHAIQAYKLCLYAIHALSGIAKRVNTGFELKDSLYYAANKKDVSFLTNEFLIRKQNGFDVELLDDVSIKTKYGFAAPGAILSHHGAQTDAYSLTHALLQHSINKGLQVYDRTYVTDVNDHKHGVKITTREGHVINSKKIIYATGYEVTEFVSKKIVKLQSTYASCSENLNECYRSWDKGALIWNTADPYLYLRSTNDNRIIIGGRDEKYYNPTMRDKLIGRKSKLLAGDFKKLYPHIPFKAEFNWTGTFGSTKDGLPFIGSYSKFPNSYFALGFGGNGITFSLLAAEIITDLLLDKKNKNAEIFTFERV